MSEDPVAEPASFQEETTIKSTVPSELPDTGRPKSDAQICVYNYALKEEKMGKYTVYSIKGSDKDGEFETQRRYSEFDKIRSVLVNRWPGVYIPPLPPKKTIQKLESKFLDERRRALEEFAKLVSEAPHLHYSEEWQLFIRSNGDLEKGLQAFQKIDYEDMLTKYTKAFSYLQDKEITNQIVLKITGTKLFLTKMIKNFDKMRKFSRSFVLSKKAFYGQLANLHHLAYVPYEKNIFSEYHANQESKNVFSNTDDAQTAAADKLKEAATRDSVEHIYEWIEQDAREIDAFLEALSQKEKYEQLKSKTQDKQRSESDGLQKVLAGKKTLKTMFSTKPKEDKITDIEKTIATHTKNLEALAALHDIITIILAYDEIDRFTKNKVERYYKMLYLSSGNELLNLNTIEDYWNSILSNGNIKPLLDE